MGLGLIASRFGVRDPSAVALRPHQCRIASR